MSKELIKIVERLIEVAEYFGINEGELASFIIVAKFNTELSNDVLSNTLKSLLVRLQRDSTLDTFEEVGIKDIEGSDLYDLLDKVVDNYPVLTEENKGKVIEALGGALQTNLVLQCFGQINKIQLK